MPYYSRSEWASQGKIVTDGQVPITKDTAGNPVYSRHQVASKPKTTWVKINLADLRTALKGK